MAECLLQKKGSALDTEGLTAVPGDVAQGETFYGSGTDDIQTGTIVKQPIRQQLIGINGSYTVPAGIFEPGNYVSQNIATQGATTVTPTSTGVGAGVSGKYMTGNVIIKGVENLIPENIRMGAVVGDISGTWRGYVNTSALTPYWYGIFYPGQSGTIVRSVSVAEAVVDWYRTTTSSDHPFIFITSDKQGITPAIGFTNSITLDGVKSVTIGYALNDRSANQYTRLMLTQNYSDTLFNNSWSAINGSLGYNEMFVLPSTSATDMGVYKEATFQIANPAQLHFVYFTVGVTSSSAFKPSLAIHFVRFNQ